MKSRWHFLTSRVGIAAACFIIAAAVLLASLRVFTPVVARYVLNRDEISVYLAVHHLAVRDVTASWQGLGPVIILHDLAWQPDKEQLVHLNEVELRFSLLQSWFNHQWLPFAATIAGGEIDGKRLDDLFDNTPATDDLISTNTLVVLHQLERLQWKDVMLSLPHHEQTLLVNSAGRIKNSVERHRLELTLQRPGESLSVLEFTADVHGLLPNWRDTRGTAYMAWYDNDMASILAPYQLADLQLQTGAGEINAWVDWQQGEIKRVQTVLGLQQVHVTSPDKTRQLAGSVSGHVLWEQKANNDWVLSADDWKLQLADKTLPVSQFRLLKSSDVSDSDQYEFVSSQIQLSVINQIAALWQGPIAESLAKFTADGLLHDLAVSLTLNEQTQHIEKLAARSHFTKLGIFAHDLPAVPGLQGINGEVYFDDTKGTLIIYSNDARVDYGPGGIEPFAIDQLRGRIEWQKQDTNWVINGQDLVLATADGRLFGQTNITLAADGNLNIDSNMSLSQVNIKSIPRYIPLRLLSPQLSQWLKTSLQGGSVESGAVIFNGALANFPFDDGNGHYEISLNIANGKLQFDPTWPSVDAIHGELVFTGRSMLGRVASGQIYDIAIGPSSVDIPLISKDPTEHIILKAQAQGDLQSGYRYIQNTPLWADLKAAVQSIIPKGQGILQLEFDLPLADNKPLVYLKGLLTTDKATLNVPNWAMQFNEVQGTLQFTEHSMNAHKITAVSDLLGPMVININTIDTKGQPRYTEVLAKGHLAIADLAKRYPNSWWSFLAGDTDYVARLQNFDDAPTNNNLQFTSTLQGVSSKLPDFLAKAAGDSANFTVDIHWPSKNIQEYHGKYNQQLEGAALFQQTAKGQQFTSGVLAFNEALDKHWHNQKGLLISGSLDDLKGVIKLMDLFPSPSAGQNSFINIVREIQLYIKNLAYAGFVANGAELSLQPQPDSWDITLESPETAGTIELPHTGVTQPMVVNLTRCHKVAAEKTVEQEADNPLKPQDIPALNFNCKEATYQQELIGDVKLVTKKESSGLFIEDFSVTHPEYELTATGEWLATDSQQRSHFSGKLFTKNLNDTLLAWNLQSEISSGEGDITFDVNWAASLFNFKAALLNGNIAVNLKNGHISEVNSGVGRVVSLFSLESLQKRLRLDFKDIFSNGFFFDLFKGNLSLQQGVVFTKDLTVKSSSADLAIAGKTDIASQILDLDVTVLPHVSNTLPIAVGLATANPALGAIVWAADKVLGSEVDKIVQYKYKVTGSWDEPNVVRQSSNITH